MALTDKELNRLVVACNKLKDGKHYRFKHYVENMINTVLDFQMHVSVVEASTDYFFDNHDINSHRKLKALVDSFPNTKNGNLRLANCMWNNNHWSRAKFLRKLMQYFEENGIRGQKSLEKWAKTADFESDVYGKIKIKEHSMGYAIFKWLQLKCGVNTVKPDVHIIRYVSRAIKRQVAPEEAVKGLKDAAKILKRRAYRIDSAIWNLERSNT